MYIKSKLKSNAVQYFYNKRSPRLINEVKARVEIIQINMGNNLITKRAYIIENIIHIQTFTFLGKQSSIGSLRNLLIHHIMHVSYRTCKFRKF